MSLLKGKFSLRAAALPILLSATLLSACSGPKDPDVSARQDIMKNWGDAMGVMGDMVKAPDTFEAEKFQKQAVFLAEDAKNPWVHFKTKDAPGHTTDAVWNDPEGFKAEADNFQKVTEELKNASLSSTSLEDVQPQFKEVAASCKSCHKEYKVKDDD